jgi:uncharacterized membrane protein YhhN
MLSAAVVAIGTRLIIGAPAAGANGPLQAFFAGFVIFGAYLLVAATAGYFGLKAMPLMMGAGVVVGIIAMLWTLKSLGNEGWSGAAAVGALIQMAGVAFMASIFTEAGVYIWKLVENKRSKG